MTSPSLWGQISEYDAIQHNVNGLFQEQEIHVALDENENHKSLW